MINKIFLAAAVAITGMMFTGESQAEAQVCRGGGYGYAVPAYRSSYRAHYAPRPVYATPYRGHGYGGYGYRAAFPTYGYGRPGFGYGGYPGFYGRGTAIGVGRGGLSIGIGF